MKPPNGTNDDNTPTAASDTSDNLIREDKHFGGHLLYTDLIQRTTWFNNVRSGVSRSSWGKLRKRFYDRVDYNVNIVIQIVELAHLTRVVITKATNL